MVSEDDICDMEEEDQEDYISMEDNDSDSDLELEDICPLRDDSKITFLGHSKGILCLDIDDKRNIAYTGGLDNNIIVWELNSGRKIAELNAHTDSVTHLKVSNEGSILASGDINGIVILWQRNGNVETWNKLFEIEAATIVDLRWSSNINAKQLFICDIMGTVQSWNMDTIEQGPSMYKYGQGCSCNKYCLILNDTWSAVLYGEFCNEHEDCGNTNCLQLIQNGSERVVKVDLRSNTAENENDRSDEGLGAGWANKAVAQAHILAIGDWDQMIVVSVTGQGFNAQSNINRVPIKNGGLVDQIAFAPQLPYIAFSTKTGLMGVYDFTKQNLRYLWNYGATMPVELRAQDEKEHGAGVSQLIWSPTKPVFYTAGLDGRLCEWDGRAQPSNDIPTMWGYSNIVWDMAVTSDGSALVAVSEDKAARLFLL